MKIISNFKDYYDFLVGKYGIDEKCIYERICSTEDQTGKWYKTGIYKPSHNEPGTMYNFDVVAVCGTLYSCFYYNGKHYFGADAENYIPAKIKSPSPYDTTINTVSDIYRGKQYHLQKTDLNEKEGCPVILLSKNLKAAAVKNIKLSDFDFAKILPAEQCFLQITSFLLKEKPVVDNRSDIQKIVGKGFDKVTSFRNTK